MFLSSMRSVTASFTAIALLAFTAIPGGALTPARNKPVLPTVIKSSGGLVETGVLGDAPYRIDIPAQWNHSLVVFYHGYAEDVFTYHPTEHLVGQPLPFFERGYAVIQSGYSQPGWALAQAYPETEDLRKYFVKKYGQPTETYVAGGSMGGELTSVTLELNPKPYMGGLDLCGSVGPTYVSFEHRFAIRAAFDHYFPNVMPPLVLVPADYQDNDFERRKVMNALRANPTNATLMRNLMEMHTDAEVAHNISYYTYVVGDLQRRADGNPFDNRNTIYTGTTPGSTVTDYELNDNVRRYAADPKAFEYLKHHYTSTGHLGKPMLALHTEFDPIVQVQYLPLYYAEVQAAGAQANFVQQFVAAEGHCNFTTQEIGMAFDELVRWTHGGPPPQNGLMKRPPDGKLSEPPRKPAAAPAGDVKQ